MLAKINEPLLSRGPSKRESEILEATPDQNQPGALFIRLHLIKTPPNKITHISSSDRLQGEIEKKNIDCLENQQGKRKTSSANGSPGSMQSTLDRSQRLRGTNRALDGFGPQRGSRPEGDGDLAWGFFLRASWVWLWDLIA